MTNLKQESFLDAGQSSAGQHRWPESDLTWVVPSVSLTPGVGIGSHMEGCQT